MKKIKLLNEWYGYDKKISIPENKITNRDLGITSSYSYNYPNREIAISKPVISMLLSLSKDKRILALNRYFYSCDGRTDQEFIDLIMSSDISDPKITNWRVHEILERNPGVNKEGYIRWLINDFFSKDQKRSDRLFRIVELNEFMHRAEPSQTLENFLLTDTEYIEKCKSLRFEKYSELTNTLWNIQNVSFLEFGAKVALKTRSLLLPLTRSEFVKVMDYKNNPFYNRERKDTHTYEYAEMFIQGAIKKVDRVEVEKLTRPQLYDLITLKYIFNYSDYWQSSPGSSLPTRLPMLLEEIRNLSLNSESFNRNFAHMTSTGVLDKLSLTELSGVLVGYETPAAWAEPSKGKTTLERITELIDSGKADPLVVCRLISYIIVNKLEPIVLEDELDWSSFNEMPPEWTYATIPVSSKKPTKYKSNLIQVATRS